MDEDGGIRGILDLKERISEKIEKHEEEIEFLRQNLEVLDSVIKRGSFAKASSLPPGGEIPEVSGSVEAAAPEMQDVPEDIPEAIHDEPSEDEAEAVPVLAGGSEVGSAHLSPGNISIVLNEGVELDSRTPPFRSFFIERILDGMKHEDEAGVAKGSIEQGSAIDYTVEEEGGRIRGITIRNCTSQDRRDEIIRTAGWSFSKMLEKGG
ncbi:conserved hypothetical protein [Cenarchaeum symbiosum A]|uniref:Uncharacterized protein n=1 Tax=Cenarchaeum symbiosum (strain A) TaxID=414004 RepID=A0RZ41_CENSY|nr:conserved hypothetical protein [Cenarchaeum symbiosum A]